MKFKDSCVRRSTGTVKTKSDGRSGLAAGAAKKRGPPGGDVLHQRNSSANCHTEVATDRSALRARSVRRVGPARLTRRCRPNTWMCERADQTEKVRRGKAPAACSALARQESRSSTGLVLLLARWPRSAGLRRQRLRRSTREPRYSALRASPLALLGADLKVVLRCFAS
jgi:hypothetical protein